MGNKGKLNFKDIGARIRLEREKLNLTREKFAEIVGLSSFYIGQIERGDRRMSLETLAKIATSLHQSVDYLLYGEDAYEVKIELGKDFSVLESTDKDYDPYLDEDLKELFLILSQCSNKEIILFKDLIKLIIPYINR
ncbi:Transcriptional regulator, XRE family [[Clostridium] ultunense Esp]|uniref:Transcriptional regulator, XRE family n=1 Tax=[Clostridium] ultunense Esp TaxID=1288971 RepID=M1Z590_9FIRM|nr:helix-turn-helix transcriptional regulator [Schnuerera ultunensis]CCQ98055.1 Transcriptional regulator, XRE family [[Clostridium] ultunense Esp]SHD76082.1 Transcriptional regulator, XRE family [[Clostridium] ultunense Esp]